MSVADNTARMIFTAVILAVQPMTFNELTEFLSIKIGHEPSERRRRTRAVILSACSPFVEADYEADFANPAIRLVHKSIGDFLTQDPTTIDFVTESCYRFFIKYQEGQTEISRRCLTYLNYEVYDDFNVAELDEDSVDHGFLKYASIFWHQHVQEAGPSEYFYDEIKELLRSPNMWTCVRIQSKFAPHMFAKLVAYQGKENSYDMSISGNTSGLDTAEEFYAHALPQWLSTHDDQGHHLNWGYHMFVREWGEVLLRYPDKIQTYFASVLGPKSFWHVNNQPSDVKVDCFDETLHQQDRVIKYHTANSGSPTWHRGSPVDVLTQASYIKDTVRGYRGDWQYQHHATVSQQDVSASIYRYKQKSKNSKAGDDTDSDTENDTETETSEDEVLAVPVASDPAIWFLSVTTGPNDVRWFHHKAKAGILQKSAPIFIPSSQWLLWPQDESKFLFLNTNKFETSVFSLLSMLTPDLMIISQGMYLALQYRVQMLIQCRCSCLNGHKRNLPCFNSRIHYERFCHQAHENPIPITRIAH